MLIESDQKENDKSKTLASNKRAEEDNPIDNTENDGSEDPGSELDSIREYIRKHDSDKEHPKPQDDEALNSGFTTENDT